MAYDPKDWAWWTEACDAVADGHPEKIGSASLPVTDEPMQGFYRMRTHKDGPFIAVRIWYTPTGALKGMKNKTEASEQSVRGGWTHCCRNPISHENYEAFINSIGAEGSPNGVWFDEMQVSVGGKVSSSQSGDEKPAKAKAKRAPRRANPADAAPAQVEAQVDAVAEEAEMPATVEVINQINSAIVEKMFPDKRTEAQKAAFWSNGNPKFSLSGAELDKDGNELDDYGEVVVKKPIARLPEMQPGSRFWFNRNNNGVFRSPEDFSNDPTVDEITEERYYEVVEERSRKVAAQSKPAPEPEAENDRAVIGSNSGEDDPDEAGLTDFERKVKEIDAWEAKLDKLLAQGPVKTKAVADLVADVKTKIWELHQNLDGMRTDERKPHMDAAAAVQTRYVPILNRAKSIRDRAADSVSAFIKEANRLEQLRVEAENKRLRDEAVAAAKAAGVEEPVEVKEVVAKNVGVGTRKTVSQVKTKRAVINDAKAAMIYFANQETVHDDFLVVLRKLGDKMMRLNIPVPGMEMKEEVSAR